MNVLLNTHSSVALLVGIVFTSTAFLFSPKQAIAEPIPESFSIGLNTAQLLRLTTITEQIAQLQNQLLGLTEKTEYRFHDVPFYSQFSDISRVEWRKVGCGIASVAMLIDFYSQETVSVDGLLEQGIQTNAYLNDAGWIHSGLINLATQYGLSGQSHGLDHLSMDAAFAELERVVADGPVMVSVHYTFQPTNPIPHLAVITGVDNGRVYYNDPADSSGQKNISIEQFKSAWKKRYIEIRPNA